MAHLRAAVAALAVLALLGCGPAPAVGAGGDPVPVEVLALDAQAYGTGPIAALTTDPVALRLFAGWFGKAERDDTGRGGRVAPAPGRTLLAVTDSTGCRLATGVEVRRSGDDLTVAFTGGQASQTCTRAYGPVALLSLPAEAVAGVRTIGGHPPVAADGPGVPTGFFPLHGGPGGAVEIGRGDAASALAARLARDGDDAAAAALSRPVRPGTRAFGFVVTGCRDTAAVLLVTHDGMSAEAEGGAGITCYLPEFSLATFEVPADRVPEPPVRGT